MIYRTKIRINGIEVTEGGDRSSPSISSVQMIDTACQKSMEIGAASSDCLKLTINRPFKNSFDGDKIEFFVSPVESSESTKEKIEIEVGDDSTLESIDSAEETYIDEADEEEEELTESELAEAEAYDNALQDLQNDFFEGEETPSGYVETDGSEEPEWIKKGTFFVHKEVRSSDSVSLTCYDSLSLCNGVFKAAGQAQTFNAWWQLLQSELSAIGVVLADYEIDSNESLKIKLGTTHREALGLLCGYAGGFATSDEDGVLNISFYSYTGVILIEEDLLSYSETSSGEIIIDCIECEDDNGNTIASEGGGQSISFKNYLVTESVLNSVHAPLYRGIRFEGATLNTPWSHELVAGEFIRVMSKAEYSNYLRLRNATEDTSAEQNSLGKVLLISSQTITFGGNATSVISSACDSVTAAENANKGDAFKKELLNRLAEAEKELNEALNSFSDADKAILEWCAGNKQTITVGGKTYTDQAFANKVFAYDITAANTINGVKINAGTITGSIINGGTIDGVKITGSEITGAKIKDFDADGFSVQNGWLVTNSVECDTLSVSTVMATPYLEFNSDFQEQAGGSRDIIDVYAPVTCWKNITLKNGYRIEGEYLKNTLRIGSITSGGKVWLSDANASAVHLYGVYAKASSSGRTVKIDDDALIHASASSSLRYKEDIKLVRNEELNPEKLYDLKVWQYRYRDGYLVDDDPKHDAVHIGLLAEDVKHHYPIALIKDEYNNAENWDERYIIPPMLALIQNQHKEIETLKQEVDELKKGLLA